MTLERKPRDVGQARDRHPTSGFNGCRGQRQAMEVGGGGGDLNPVLVGSSDGAGGGGGADCPGLHPEGQSNRALGPHAGFIMATPSERHGEECGGGRAGRGAGSSMVGRGGGHRTLGGGGEGGKSTHRTRRLLVTPPTDKVQETTYSAWMELHPPWTG